MTLQARHIAFGAVFCASACVSQQVRLGEPAMAPSVTGDAATGGQQIDGGVVTPEAADVLEKHVTAIGGREAQDAVKVVETEREIQMFGATQKRYDLRETQGLRFYSKTEGSQGVLEAGFDGTRGWERSPFFRGYYSDTDPRSKMIARKRFELYQYQESRRPFARLPNETVDGSELIVLRSSSPEFDPNGRVVPVKYYFDPRTFYLRRMAIGTEVIQTQTFDDFRLVDCTWVPFATEIRSPQAALISKLKTLRYNVPIDPSRFEFGGKAGNSTPAPPPRQPPNPATGSDPSTSSKDELSDSMRLDSLELVFRVLSINSIRRP